MTTTTKQVAIEGQRIKAIRNLTHAEKEAEGWNDYGNENVLAIVLENGIILYPSADYEGNGGGVMFGLHKGESFAL